MPSQSLSANTKASLSPSTPPSLEERFDLLEARFTQPIMVGNTKQTSQQFHHQQHLPEHSNLSEHSFGFDDMNDNPNHHSSNHAIMTSPTSFSNTSNGSRNSNGNNLDRVSQAAARHMEKVAAAVAAATSHHSTHSNSSQQTLVTGNQGHHGQQRQQQSQGRVVAESPPILVSPHNQNKNNNIVVTNSGAPSATQHMTAVPAATKPNVARTLLGNTTNTTGSSTSTKRKSQQPKRKVSSIKDTLDQDNSDNHTSNHTGVETSPEETASSNKRPRHAASKSSTAANSTNTNYDNGMTASLSNDHLNIHSNRSRSPKSLKTFSEHSRDRSNGSTSGRYSKRGNMSNGATSGNTTAAGTVPPINNRSIHDFFGTATRKIKKPSNGNQSAMGTNSATASNKNRSVTPMPQNSNSTDPVATASTINNKDVEYWQTQCMKLQQQVDDKDEQLKAVTNNKTILHTALQSALQMAKDEIQELQQSSQDKQQQMMNVIEDLLRFKFQQQAKDIRSTLLSDGTRLGKIVYARVGMRTVESWEEGYATKELQRRKHEIQTKKRTLLERQKQISDANQDSTLSSLDAQEARESIHMHLQTLRQEEQEILVEEQTLNDEKGTHIRALKLVASEDASRFNTRPKLHDRYVLDQLLGKGGFSEVWKGYDLQDLREVAVKIHQLDPRWPESKKENYTKHVTREYEIHRNVRHPRIVSLYDVFEIDNNSFATVLECCKGTDLDTLLKSKKRLPERQARAILLQILSGMQYLSQPSGSRQGVIHYDLKPANILFDEHGDAKITDFGLSKIVDAQDPADSMELTSQGAGTYWYLPPECFVTGEQVRISNKVDVWSIGIIFYQMLFGRRPFGEGKSQDKLLADHTMLNAQQVYMPDKPAISDGGKEFLKQCLMYDQAYRPTIAQICENSYVLQEGIL